MGLKATPLIDDGKHPKGSAVNQRIRDKTPAPALVRAGCCRWNFAMEARLLAAAYTNAQWQTLEPINPAHAL